jgi:hypothetical protein
MKKKLFAVAINGRQYITLKSIYLRALAGETDDDLFDLFSAEDLWALVDKGLIAVGGKGNWYLTGEGVALAEVICSETKPFSKAAGKTSDPDLRGGNN